MAFVCASTRERKVRTAEHMVPTERWGRSWQHEWPVRATVTNRVAPDATAKLLGAQVWKCKLPSSGAILPAATDDLHLNEYVLYNGDKVSGIREIIA